MAGKLKEVGNLNDIFVASVSIISSCISLYFSSRRQLCVFQAGSYMLTSVLPTRSFHQLFLIRLLLMVVMAAFLAHWKVVLLKFSTNHLSAHSCGDLKGLVFSDSAVHKEN